MAVTLGSSGLNRNFAPGFNPTGLQVLAGYESDGPNPAARWYSSVDIRREIPKDKLAAVVTAVAALGLKIQFSYGAWPMTGGGARGFRLFLSHPARKTPSTAAVVQTALDDIETAVTA